MSNLNKPSLKNNVKKQIHEPQVEYLGRWVNPNLFRAFVYNKYGEEKLANSYREFKELTSSGLWFETKEASASVKKGKPKDDTVRTTG